MIRCIWCQVTGRVQGVWFRASTQERAQRLGLTGYARNRPDGRVEVLACGGAAALQELEGWLWEGPPAAEVDEVVCAPLAATPPERFTIG